jgi:hypothetical protein
MGASQGKSKKELKEEAREWAITKENEVAELYAQNTELRNQILMMQEDMRALRDMLKGQQSALNESVKQVNEELKQQKSETEAVKQAFETFKQNMFNDAGEYHWIGSRQTPGLGDYFASRIAHRFMPPSEGILEHEKNLEKYRKERLSNTGLFG